MDIKQISVFLENKKGRLADVTETLSENGINIRALFLADTTDFGVLRMIVTDPDKALGVLKKHNFVAQETDVIACEVEDKPGGLNKILQLLNANDINIEYMYAFVEKKVDNAVVVFKIDENRKAVDVLRGNNIGLVTRDVLQSL
ncbi:MAG: ACT domain-containing protein [Spirochaetales bacterium]|nr:ACT domain-containing protein [Spirochaetales bacterium]